MRLLASLRPIRQRTRHDVPGAFSSLLGAGSVLSGGVGEQALVDLAQRDREGLLLRGGVDQRADVLQETLGELAVVGVDLPRALGGEDHQAVLAAGALEQLVDRRVRDALGMGCDSGQAGRLLSRWWARRCPVSDGRATAQS